MEDKRHNMPCKLSFTQYGVTTTWEVPQSDICTDEPIKALIGMLVAHEHSYQNVLRCMQEIAELNLSLLNKNEDDIQGN